jgi:hypothetical protein
MNQPLTHFNFEISAKQTITETTAMIQTLLVNFKKTVFPLAKQEALDSQTVCIIEDEFVRQEVLYDKVLNQALKEFCDNKKGILERLKNLRNNYAHCAVTIAESFLIATRGLFFTYYNVDLSTMSPRVAHSLFQKATLEYTLLQQKQGYRDKQISRVSKKVFEKIKQDEEAFEHRFSMAIKNVIEIDVPAFKKRMETTINQNYLQHTSSEWAVLG